MCVGLKLNSFLRMCLFLQQLQHFAYSHDDDDCYYCWPSHAAVASGGKAHPG
jgi:hypothetical protein